ncbi:MAG: AEC family transporter [Erysipelotrichaceae bacterium]|nr:AEC family transporter [Erysipelotrichaceae bacterium]
MNSFVTALNVVLPLLLLVVVGYLLKLRKFFSDTTLKQMNKLVFTLLIPASLLKSILTSSIQDALQPKYLLFVLAGVAGMILSGILLGEKLCERQDQKGVMAQAIFRGNTVLFGIPVVSMLYPNESIVLTTSMIAIVVPIFNLCAVVSLQLHAGMKTDFKSLLISVLKNPMVIATLSGFTLKLLGVEVPAAILKTVTEIGNAANPIGLIVLGASFELPAISENIKKLSIIALMRMILWPVIMMSLAIFLGYRGIELATVMVLFGAPTAVSSFATAVQMKGDGALASQAVMLTTALSVFTIFTWVFALTQLNML